MRVSNLPQTTSNACFRQTPQREGSSRRQGGRVLAWVASATTTSARERGGRPCLRGVGLGSGAECKMWQTCSRESSSGSEGSRKPETEAVAAIETVLRSVANAISYNQQNEHTAGNRSRKLHFVLMHLR